MPERRSIEDIRGELIRLHADDSVLLTQAHQLRPTLKLMVFRRPLTVIDGTLDRHFREFVALDADLIQCAVAPADTNTAIRNSAQFSFHAAIRDSVRGLLTDCSAAAAGVQTRLDFIAAVALSVIALAISAITLVVGAAG